MTTLDATTLARFKRDPIAFIEHVLCDPETGEAFVLSEAERWFLKFAFQLDNNGRLKFPELVFGAIKKSGKTTLAAIIMLVMILLYGGRFAEGFCVANDLEQAQSRVFAIIRRIIEASPLLRAIAKLTADKVSFPALDATIIAIASDAASAAGANPTIVVFDELWGFSRENSRRLWDEMVTSPARKVSAGSPSVMPASPARACCWRRFTRAAWRCLRSVRACGLATACCSPGTASPSPRGRPRAGSPTCGARMRPNAYARMIENQFVSSESTFVDMRAWDACVEPSLTPVLEDRQLHIWAGVDASVKRDATALVACTYDKKAKCVRLVQHRIFTPTPGDPIDFEATVEATLLDWNKRFRLRKVYFDPYQMASVSQRLAKAHVKIEEYPQTVPNLTAATSESVRLAAEPQCCALPRRRHATRHQSRCPA